MQTITESFYIERKVWQPHFGAIYNSKSKKVLMFIFLKWQINKVKFSNFKSLVINLTPSFVCSYLHSQLWNNLNRKIDIHIQIRKYIIWDYKS